MQKVFGSLLFLLVLVCGPISIAGQDLSSLLEKIESPAARQGLDWKLSRKEFRERSSSYQWESKGSSGGLSIASTGSQEEASTMLHKTMMRVSVGPKTKLTGLGDEAFLYYSDRQHGCMILFRKLNVFVHMTGSSVTVVERLGRRFADLIPGK